MRPAQGRVFVPHPENEPHLQRWRNAFLTESREHMYVFCYIFYVWTRRRPPWGFFNAPLFHLAYAKNREKKRVVRHETLKFMLLIVPQNHRAFSMNYMIQFQP